MSLSWKKLLPAIACLTLPSLAFAGSESGFYIGGSLTQTSIDYDQSYTVDFDDVSFEDEDNGYKIFGGYNFGLLPLLDIAVELGYVDFGSYEAKVADVTSSQELSALTGSALIGTTLGPVGLFAKAGLVDWSADYRSDVLNDKDSGTDPAYGIGAKVQLGSVAVRAEYEMFDLNTIDIDMISVGLSYTF